MCTACTDLKMFDLTGGYSHCRHRSVTETGHTAMKVEPTMLTDDHTQ